MPHDAPGHFARPHRRAFFNGVSVRNARRTVRSRSRTTDHHLVFLAHVPPDRVVWWTGGGGGVAAVSLIIGLYAALPFPHPLHPHAFSGRGNSRHRRGKTPDSVRRTRWFVLLSPDHHIHDWYRHWLWQKTNYPSSIFGLNRAFFFASCRLRFEECRPKRLPAKEQTTVRAESGWGAVFVAKTRPERTVLGSRDVFRNVRWEEQGAQTKSLNHTYFWLIPFQNNLIIYSQNTRVR